MNKIIFYIFILFIFFSCSTNNLKQTNLIEENIDIIFDLPGEGEKLKKHYKVTVHYIGKLENGNVFENSYEKNKPFTFQLGLRQVIEGWEIAMKDMRVGGKRTFKIPPNLAYGKKGIKNIIPPNSSLIFEIEILKIQPHNYFLITSDVLMNIDKELFIIDSKNKFNLIDIRIKKNQLKTGIIKNSHKIEAFNENGQLNRKFIDKLKKLHNKKNHTILISESGDISSILANGLVENLKMKNVYSLKGGIKRWSLEGKKLIN